MIAQPPQTPAFLWALAREYYRRAEAYDRTVCTGPISSDGVLPATYKELAVINRHASQLLREMFERARVQGFAVEQLRCAMRSYLFSGQRKLDLQCPSRA